MSVAVAKVRVKILVKILEVIKVLVRVIESLLYLKNADTLFSVVISVSYI